MRGTLAPALFVGVLAAGAAFGSDPVAAQSSERGWFEGRPEIFGEGRRGWFEERERDRYGREQYERGYRMGRDDERRSYERGRAARDEGGYGRGSDGRDEGHRYGERGERERGWFAGGLFD